MPFYQKSKYGVYQSNLYSLGGSYGEIKSPEEKEKDKNTITVSKQKIERQNATVGENVKKMSDEKLRRFINFTI